MKSCSINTSIYPSQPNLLDNRGGSQYLPGSGIHAWGSTVFSVSLPAFFGHSPLANTVSVIANASSRMNTYPTSLPSIRAPGSQKTHSTFLAKSSFKTKLHASPRIFSPRQRMIEHSSSTQPQHQATKPRIYVLSCVIRARYEPGDLFADTGSL